MAQELSALVALSEDWCVVPSPPGELALSSDLWSLHTHTNREREKETETDTHTHTHTNTSVFFYNIGDTVLPVCLLCQA